LHTPKADTHQPTEFHRVFPLRRAEDTRKGQRLVGGRNRLAQPEKATSRGSKHLRYLFPPYLRARACNSACSDAPQTAWV